MTVTNVDIGRTVRWTENDQTSTGQLIRVREPGTPSWWNSHGKALVLRAVAERAIPVDGYRSYVEVHPTDLEVVDDEVAGDG